MAWRVSLGRKTRRFEMTDAETIGRRYIETWNEADAGRRRALLSELWTEDATFVDPVLNGEGRAGVDAVMAQVRQRYPGHRFALLGKPDGFGDYIRLSWALGPEGGEAPIKGTDFLALKGGRLKSVTGFFDQLPA
jgi:hypothetical protein